MKRLLSIALAVLLSLPTLAGAQAAPTQVADPCDYPDVSQPPDATRRVHAVRVFEEVFEHYDAIDVPAGCAAQWRDLLREIAELQGKAVQEESKDYSTYLGMELKVRLSMATSFADARSLDGMRQRYRRNLERIAEIYRIKRKAWPLILHLRSDKHFRAEVEGMSSLHEVLQLAIYSCNDWDFSVPKSRSRKYKEWKSCVEEFKRLARQIPELKEIAPESFDYVVRMRSETGHGVRLSAVTPRNGAAGQR